MASSEPAVLAERFLQIIEDDIVPKTRAAVAAGNKVFGAAILKKDDLSLLAALVAEAPEAEHPALRSRIDTLAKTYAGLSAIYQAQKGNADIPLS